MSGDRRSRPERGGRGGAGDRGGTTGRAQSHVVGVALLLGVAMISLGALTAGVGSVVQSGVASADAERVAADLDDALRPTATGPVEGRVSFVDGRLRTVEREVRLLNESGVVAVESADALVYESRAGVRRVTWLAGAVVRGRGTSARLTSAPAATAGDGTLLVGAPTLNGSAAVGGTGATSVGLRTNVSHERRAFGPGRYRFAVETATPAAWERRLGRDGPTIRRDFDGDGVDSVVVAYPGSRTAYLVVHDLRLEVRRG